MSKKDNKNGAYGRYMKHIEQYGTFCKREDKIHDIKIGGAPRSLLRNVVRTRYKQTGVQHPNKMLSANWRTELYNHFAVRGYVNARKRRKEVANG